ncbi:MAG: methyltransferase domain-containing protein [Candidatus Pacebacteria bacterium]|nr:methyltransferase domain-containing protein [Candidatus Paceibacterota bacterium]
MKKWSDFYDKKLSVRGLINDIVAHIYLIWNVLKYRPRKVLEIGTARGTMGFFISFFVPKVIGIDNDHELVERAKQSIKKKNFIIKYADAFNLPFKNKEFNVVFSQGFIEHFGNEEIKKLINESLRVTNIVIISVPNNLYGEKDFGNERLLKHKEWCELFRSLGFNVVKCKSYWPINWKKIFSISKNQTLIIVSR